MELNDDEALRRFFQDRFKNYEPEQLELGLNNQYSNYRKIRRFMIVMIVVSIMLVNFSVIQTEPNTRNNESNITKNATSINQGQTDQPIAQKQLLESSDKSITNFNPGLFRSKQLPPAETQRNENRHKNNADLSPILSQKLEFEIKASVSDIEIKHMQIAQLVISKETPARQGFSWSISAGPFVNFNWFKPRQHDRYLVTDFRQNKNLFDNRLGFQVQGNIGLIQLKKFNLSPTVRYSYLHKSYSFNIADLTVEEPVSSSVQINHAFHFVGLGFQVEHPKRKTSVGIQYLKMLNNDSGLNSHQLEFQFNARLQIGKGSKPFTLEPTIGYTIPLSEMPFLRVSMINLGLRVPIARSK